MQQTKYIAMPFVQAVSSFPILGTPATNSHQVTKTAMTKEIYEHEEDSPAVTAATPWGAWGKAEDVTKAAVFLASDDAAWVTGIGLPVDGGWLAQ